MAEATTKTLVYKTKPSLVAWPCTISVPVSGGKREEQQITARFNVLSQEELEKAFPAFAPLRDFKAQHDFMVRAIDGFDDLKTEDGKRVDDEEAKKTLLALPYALDGLIDGYVEMIGRRARKN